MLIQRPPLEYSDGIHKLGDGLGHTYHARADFAAGSILDDSEGNPDQYGRYQKFHEQKSAGGGRHYAMQSIACYSRICPSP